MVKTKGGFFQKVRCVFQISKKDTPKTILNLKFKFPANSYTVIGGKFKFQAQDSFLEYFYFGDLKNESLFLKKNTFSAALKNPLQEFKNYFCFGCW